jgi:cyclohexanone monooxygenase
VGTEHDVLIIGAGFSGMGVASSLDRAGMADYLLVEEGDGFGGTWYWNRYPGIAVDIPSFSYQYSYAKRTSWTRVYAPGEELRDYAEQCAQRFGLHNRVRFGTKITGATFDEQRHRWQLETDCGDAITARFVIDATGVLTQPKLPEIEGVETFAGVTMHTARWDHEQSLSGKRVAVIGTGASAVQLIPAVAPDVEHLTVFQRTPIWCLPKLDGPLPQSVRWFMRRVPGGAAAARLVSQSLVELMFPLAAHYHGTLRLATAFESTARKYLRE